MQYFKLNPNKMKNNHIRGIFPYVLKKANKLHYKKHTYYNCTADKALNGKKIGAHILYSVPNYCGKMWSKEIEREENPLILLIDFYH